MEIIAKFLPHSDQFGDHALNCGYSGERISRHNMLTLLLGSMYIWSLLNQLNRS